MKRTADNVKIISATLRRSTTTKALEDFLSDLLSKDEQEHLAQRISIAKELIHSTSVDETARKVKASTSTVSDVMQVIKHGSGGYRKISGNESLWVNKKIKVRLRLVIIKNNKLLVTYDSVNNYFFYIGGKLEFGETVKNGCQREVAEECGPQTKFVFKKILYLRDFIISEKNEHSLELFILRNINRFKELEGKKDDEFRGKKWLTWLNMDKLPDNLFPKSLTSELLRDYRRGFPKSGEYIGKTE